MSKFYSALFVSSTCFRPQRSIIRSVLYKLYSQTLVSGNTCTTVHVQPLQSCRKNNVKHFTFLWEIIGLPTTVVVTVASQKQALFNLLHSFGKYMNNQATDQGSIEREREKF